MNILKNAFHVTPGTRRIIVMLISIVTLNSVQTPVAKAAEVPLETVALAITDEFSVADTTKARGIILQDEPLPIEIKVKASLPIAKKASHLKLKNADAPDTDTQLQRSDDSARRSMIVAATAYTSDPAETDSTPFITANGTRVRDGIIAANFLRFGTRVRIPQYYGDKVFVVTDRMNPKFNERIDIWMNDKAQAYAWGVRRVKIEVLP